MRNLHITGFMRAWGVESKSVRYMSMLLTLLLRMLGRLSEMFGSHVYLPKQQNKWLMP